MAEKEKKEIKETKETKVIPEKVAVVSKYTIEELAGGARNLFNCSPDLVTAALIIAGQKEYSKDDARAIVKNFLERKVEK